jgi:hypothetical protein
VFTAPARARCHWFNSFSVKAIEGIHRFFELFSIVAHLFHGCEEEYFGLAAIINGDFGDVPSVDVDGDNHGIIVGE